MRIHAHTKDHFYSAESEADILYYQPFLLMSLETTGKNLSVEELAVVKWLYNFLWMMYKNRPFIDSVPVGPDRFIKAECEALWLFDDLEELTDPQEREELLLEDLEGQHSKELLSVLFKQFEVNPFFKMVNRKSEGAVLAGVRAWIQCFDDNIRQRWD